MNVVDANGETEMDEDQWEAASTSSPALMRPLLTRKQIFTSPLQWKSVESHQAGPGTDTQIWYCKSQMVHYIL